MTAKVAAGGRPAGGAGTAVKAYEQVADILRRRVVAGELEPGARLPTETMLATEFGVSRERVRQIEVRAFEKVQKAVKKGARELEKPREPAAIAG